MLHACLGNDAVWFLWLPMLGLCTLGIGSRVFCILGPGQENLLDRRFGRWDETCQTSLFLNAFSRAPIVDKCIVCSIGLTHTYVVQRAFVTGSCVKGIRIWDSLTDTFFTFAYVAIFSFMCALTRSVCFGTLINFATCPHIRVHSAIFWNSL